MVLEKYNYTVAGKFKYRQIQDSIARNPEFQFLSSWYIPAYRETIFPINFFINGHQKDGQLDLDGTHSFFQHYQMPNNFHQISELRGFEGLDLIFYSPGMLFLDSKRQELQTLLT